MNFYETQMGQKFFSCQLPALIKALQSIAGAIERHPATVELSNESIGENDILHEIYNGNYQPESQKRKADNPLDLNVLQTAHTLLHTLSPKQQELFCEYEDAANARSDHTSERAFKDGFRLAVQMILDGCRTSDSQVQDVPAKERAI